MKAAFGETVTRVGTAGWSIPKPVRDRFADAGPLLQRYAQRFSCVEINSTFYRPHRVTTYERWAQSVPDGFRFALKVPKAITHDRRLLGCEDLLDRFVGDTAALGDKRDVLLVQLPPSFAFDSAVVANFFDMFRARYPGLIACEPRHQSWFAVETEALLCSMRVARVAADPAIHAEAARPGGWRGLAYFRWHGSPRTYYSSYEDERLDAFAAAVERSDRPAWFIFDNTTLGAATQNALTFSERMR